MYPFGLGSDIIEIERIAKAYTRHGIRFCERLLTPEEQAYCLRYRDPIPHIAGRFAAKEAISKALGTGIQENLSWHDIEIRNDVLGKPEAFLSPRAATYFAFPHIFLTISHCRAYATATAFILKQTA